MKDLNNILMIAELHTFSIPSNALLLILYVGTGLLCLLFYLLCYPAVLLKFTYYAQNYAQE